MARKQMNSKQEAGWLSWALWQLFDTTAFNWPYLSDSDQDKAAARLDTAKQAVTTAGLKTSNYANVYIYTANPMGASQEYLVVSMAEPPSLAVISLDLLAVAGLVLFVRRRSTQARQLMS